MPNSSNNTAGTYDVVGIGNAMVDVVSSETYQFAQSHCATHNCMTLIDEQASEQLYQLVTEAQETSGGSAANTMVGLSRFGSQAAFIGKVKEDPLGKTFIKDLKATRVHFAVEPSQEGPPTGRCIIVVTPDAARTMHTHLGIARFLVPEDIDQQLIENSKVLYCEGYIWDEPTTKETINQAIEIAKSAGNTVSLSLSDPICVERNLNEWRDIVSDSVDLLFGNREEYSIFFNTHKLEDIIKSAREVLEMACVTLGPGGSMVITKDEVVEVPPYEPEQFLDTTGAGDMYAAGYMYGLTQGKSLEVCGHFGSLAATEVLAHLGGRPEALTYDLDSVPLNSLSD